MKASLIAAVLLAATLTPWANADIRPDSTALMHGDLRSTDTTQFPGPGPQPRISAVFTAATCSTVFIGSDSFPVALCTAYLGTNPVVPIAPTVKLFHPDSGAELASLQLAKGALLGGVYGYLDTQDRVVVADGNHDLLMVAHTQRSDGSWTLFVHDKIALADHVPPGDTITGLSPDDDGRIWFATTWGRVGVIDGNSVKTVQLPAGEKLANGLTIRPGGASILTTHALYEVDAPTSGDMQIVWRHHYDRGPARKPGQLSWGSGTTPTYMGAPGTGGTHDYVAIIDNAIRPELIVLDTRTGEHVCRMRAFESSGQGTENSLMVAGNSVIAVSTYGFEYMPMAVDGPAVPAHAPYHGGMTRIDITPGEGAGCHRVWENSERTASLPILSTADGAVHVLGYRPARSTRTLGSSSVAIDEIEIPKVGPVYYLAIDMHTGRTLARDYVGQAPVDEPMETTGTISSRGVLWQPTLTRLLRIAPR